MDDWLFLHDLWARCTRRNGTSGAAAPSRSNGETKALYARGICLDDALQFLFQEQPSLDAFTSWVTARTRPQAAPIAHEDVLSAADVRHFNEHGYLLLRGAVPREQCAAARAAIWDFLGASPGQPASWYLPHPGKSGLMLQFSDHPALQANRHCAHIRHAYQQLYGPQPIYPSIDKVSFNPPENENYRFMGSPLHWDISLRLPIPFKLQGMLYLSDCPPQHGAFHCVPGFQHRVEQWLAGVPPDCPPRDWAVSDLRPVAVDGKAGDFIIWHQALPHCATPNRGPAPRMVQYLTYLPEHCQDQDEWV